MKIAHISDLHYTSLFKKNNLDKIEFLLNYALKNKFDHLIISGDLTHNADHEDFETLRDLFKKLNLLNSDRLSVIIGNHDIFGVPQTSEDVFTFPEKCKKVDYDKKIKEFGDFFFETFQNCSYKIEDRYFPFAKVFNDVLIVGLNSNARYSKIKNPFASNGEINEKDYNSLFEILDKYNNCTKKIIAIHHHFNKIATVKNKSISSFWENIEKQTMKLKKKKKLFSLFNTFNIDLVLHGHIHETKEYYRKGIRFLNAGASFSGIKPDELKINFVNIVGNEVKIEIHKILANNFIKINGHLNENNVRFIPINKN